MTTPDRAAFDAQLSDVRRAVDARLEAIFDERVRTARTHGADVAAVIEELRALTLRGGKRFRAALAVAGFHAAGGDAANESHALAIGVALEILQAYLLVHDDWMDHDELRRGGPTVHVALRPRIGAEHADAGAILAGDFACAMAHEALFALPAATLGPVLALFTSIQQDAVYGQILDLSARAEDVERMHALKTGSYTVRGPLVLGAVLANGSAGARAALERYAAPLGVAFQLRDDLLGTFGSATETGKPFGNDLRAGKRTALVATAESRLDDDGKRAFDAAFGKTNASADVIAAAASALERCGVRSAVEARLTALGAEAEASLRDAAIADAGAAVLRGAAQALTERRA